jgi:hypothetical protein
MSDSAVGASNIFQPPSYPVGDLNFALQSHYE